VGGTTDDAVVKAVRSGQHQLEPVISREEIATVTPETPLVDLLIPSAENRLPLAVVDEHDRLLGVIPRITLLNALGGIDNGDGDSDDGATTSEPSDARSVEAPSTPSGDEGEGVRS